MKEKEKEKGQIDGYVVSGNKIEIGKSNLIPK
jgi:hypothetical protein